MRATRVAWTEHDFLQALAQGDVKLGLPPARLEVIQVYHGSYERGDARVELHWGEAVLPCVLEYKNSHTPRVLDQAVLMVKHLAQSAGLAPLLVVPYLSESSLAFLQNHGVNGIDLCGNGVVLGGGIHIWRSGAPNCFKSSAPLRNVFAGTSSIIPRCFLLQSEFDTATELRSFALGRVKSQIEGQDILTKGTVSKVIQVLLEEKLITRNHGRLQVASPEGLLEGLRTNYRAADKRLVGKTPWPGAEIWERLVVTSAWQTPHRMRFVATGSGSAGHYGLLSSGRILSLYVDDIFQCQDLDIVETSVFPNLELVEESSDAVYFDLRRQGREHWASPIQTWLELVNAGPREQEAATALESILLRGGALSL